MPTPPLGGLPPPGAAVASVGTLPSSPFDAPLERTSGSGDALEDGSGKGSAAGNAPVITIAASGSAQGPLQLSLVNVPLGSQQLSPRTSNDVFKDKDTVNEPGKAAWWEAAVHLITLMFGAGVLGLPYAMASLGWVPGVLMLALATGTSCYSAFLLADLHTLRDGRRVRTLRGLGEEVFGRIGRRVITVLQLVDMVGGAVVFTVAGGTALLDIVYGCYGDNGAACDHHEFRTWPWSVCFGGAMIILSQVPDFHSLAIVSLLGSIMPLLYSGIAFVCILVKGQAPEVDYTIVHKGSDLKTVMNVFSGIGAMAYAFGGQVVQNEVTALVATPPSIKSSMRRALTLTYGVLAVCYFAVSTSGYAMLGNRVTGNILQSIPYAAPAILANIAVLLHVGAAYQAMSMPVYGMLEEQVAKRKWLPAAVARRPWVFRTTIRTLYVCLITFLAALIPFFNQLSGLKGGSCMVPLCFISPILMWQWYHRREAGRARSLANWALIAIFACIAVVATLGSVFNIIHSASSFQIFA